MVDLTPLLDGVRELLKRIQDDESRHGGLLTRETIRSCDEMRVLLDRVQKQMAQEPV